MFGTGKTIIVYYSLEGHSKTVADAIKNEFGYDVLELKPQKEIKAKGFGKFFFGGKQAMFGEEIELKSYDININNYDNIIIGTPVWASRYAPAFNTFFSKEKIFGKNIAMYCTCAGSSGKTFELMKDKLKGNVIIGHETFCEKNLKEQNDFAVRAVEWMKSILD